MGTKVLPAREILAQARDTIAATYWIQGDEVQSWNSEEDFEWHLSRTNGANAQKFIEVYIGPGEKAKVTGVCSVGAMALAHSIVQKKKLLPNFNDLWNSDFQTRLATEALAQAIRENDSIVSQYSDSASTIIDWNDMNGRTSAEVVAMFDKALESPLLNAKALWELKSRDYRMPEGVVASTKTEATKLVSELSRAFAKAREHGIVALGNSKAEAMITASFHALYDSVPSDEELGLRVERVAFS